MRFLLLFLISFSVLAESGTYKGVSYTLEPIYGREKVRIDKDARTATTEYFYGARLTANYKILNLEAEYTRSDRGELIADDPGLSEGFEVERLKLGLFGSYQLYPWLLAIIRGGADAKRITTLTFSNNSLQKNQQATRLNPYLGLGLEAGYKLISLSIGLTTVLHGFPDDYDDNDYQFSLGVKLRI